MLEMLAKIEHEQSAQLCTAERSLLYNLEGGCQVLRLLSYQSSCSAVLIWS